MPPTTPWEQAAWMHLLERFEESYESKVCDVCRSPKWANSFFCRRCCIKLQRAKLLKRITLLRLVKTDWMTWRLVVLRYAAKRWDLCRDYLLVSPNTAKREDEDVVSD